MLSSPIRTLVLAAGALALVSFIVPSQEDPSPKRWRILVTNDDGIETKALAQLVEALAEHSDVVVCAPDSNRSGSSQSVDALGRSMKVVEAKVAGAEEAFAVSGSPADSVCYGVLMLGKDKPFDLVVSGINQGANVGDVAHYSGTVGAAMDGAYRGIPSLAVSQGGRTRDYSFTAKFTARFVEQLKQRGAQPGIVYSINSPSGDAEKIKGVAVRPMGGSYLAVTGFAPAKDETGEMRSKLRFNSEAPEGSDTEAFQQGYVTITPLHFDWTDRPTLSDLKQWELTAK